MLGIDVFLTLLFTLHCLLQLRLLAPPKPPPT